MYKGLPLNEWIRRLLVVWVGISMFLLLAGILFIVFTGGNLHESAIPLNELGSSLSNMSVQAWMTLVLIVLLIAPAATVLVVLIQSVVISNRREAFTALIVLGILLSTIWMKH